MRIIVGKYCHKFICTIVLSILILIIGISCRSDISNPTDNRNNDERMTDTLFVNLDFPTGTSIQRIIPLTNKLNAVLKKNPYVKGVQEIDNFSYLEKFAPSCYTFKVILNEHTLNPQIKDKVINQIYAETVKWQDVRCFVFLNHYLFEIKIYNHDGYDLFDFFSSTQHFLAILNQRPEIQLAITMFNPTFPLYDIDVDSECAKKFGVSSEVIVSALKNNYDTVIIKDGSYNHLLVSENYGISTRPFMINLHNYNGEYIPLDAIATVKRVYGPHPRINYKPNDPITIFGMPASGVSYMQVLDAIENVATESLPRNFSYEVQ